MRTEDVFDFTKMRRPLIIMIVFLGISIVVWQTTGKIFFLYNFMYIGIALGVGVGMYAALPKRQKPWGRRFAQFLIGTYMLVFLGLFQPFCVV